MTFSNSVATERKPVDSYYVTFYGDETVKRLRWIAEHAPWDPDDRTSVAAHLFPYWQEGAVHCASFAWACALNALGYREEKAR